MYWARAKSILIFTLLALNLFLAANLLFFRSDGGASREMASDAEAVLRARGVVITGKIQQAGGAAKRLDFVSGGYDMAKLTDQLMGLPYSDIQKSRLDNGTELKNGTKLLQIISEGSFRYSDANPESIVGLTKQNKIERFAVDFLKSKGLLPGSYRVDSFVHNTDNSVTVLFLEKYGDSPIFDNYLKVTITGKGVTEIEGNRRDIKNSYSAGEDTIMTAWQILLKNYTGDGAAVEITGADLGYKKRGDEEHRMKSSVEGPVWRVKVKGTDKPRYFDAFKGIEIN